MFDLKYTFNFSQDTQIKFVHGKKMREIFRGFGFLCLMAYQPL